MAKAYEIQLDADTFKTFTSNNYLIIEDQNFKPNDFILFKEILTVGEETVETGLYRMTSINSIINDEGLKEGYVLLNLTKL